MKYYLHIYVDGFLEYQSINDSDNDAKKDYLEMRNAYPTNNIKGVVSWEIIEVIVEG